MKDVCERQAVKGESATDVDLAQRFREPNPISLAPNLRLDTHGREIRKHAAEQQK